MKETKKVTRIFCTIMIIFTLLMQVCYGARMMLYHHMMNQEAIYEALIDKIFLLEQLSSLFQVGFLMISFMIIIYLVEELVHSTLIKDCKFAGVSFLFCMIVSILCVQLFQFPAIAQSANLMFHFLLALGLISIMNHIKVRKLEKMNSY